MLSISSFADHTSSRAGVLASTASTPKILLDDKSSHHHHHHHSHHHQQSPSGSNSGGEGGNLDYKRYRRRANSDCGLHKIGTDDGSSLFRGPQTTGNNDSTAVNNDAGITTTAGSNNIALTATSRSASPAFVSLSRSNSPIPSLGSNALALALVGTASTIMCQPQRRCITPTNCSSSSNSRLPASRPVTPHSLPITSTKGDRCPSRASIPEILVSGDHHHLHQSSRSSTPGSSPHSLENFLDRLETDGQRYDSAQRVGMPVL